MACPRGLLSASAGGRALSLENILGGLRVPVVKTRFYSGTALLAALLLPGCAKPDRIEKINSPTSGVFYTVETFYGHGAPNSDFTRVYAHLERGGKSDKELVIDGDDLEFSKIVWDGPHDVTLCMHAGFTNSFRSEVTLSVESTSETIYNHLQESSRPCTADCR